jgi:hypothetical protein
LISLLIQGAISIIIDAAKKSKESATAPFVCLPPEHREIITIGVLNSFSDVSAAGYFAYDRSIDLCVVAHSMLGLFRSRDHGIAWR